MHRGTAAMRGMGTQPTLPQSRALPPRAGRRRLHMHAAVVGIDLGTSNSAVAAMGAGGRAAVLVDAASGEATVPSVVTLTESGTLVGRPALQAAHDPHNTFYSFKRLMGHKLAEVVDEAARMRYIVAEGDRGEAHVYCPALDDMLPPEELSAALLRHLAALAEGQLGEPVTGAVITVPAHFGQAQKGATLGAAEAAGIPNVHLLQEPVAAALAYGVGGGTDGETVLVFDLGGGTFDVSILQAFEGIMEVLGTAGDSRLGGDDMDAALATYLQQAAAASGSGGGDADATRQWALHAAEGAKVALSAGSEAAMALPGGGSLALTQQQFEAATAQLFSRMAAVLEQLGKRTFVEWAVPPSQAAPGSPSSSGSSTSGGNGSAEAPPSSSSGSSSSSGDRWAPPPRRITQVVLVGQCTRLPSIRQWVARATGVQPLCTVDPAEAVALGAAIHAGMLLGEVSSVELMDGGYAAELHSRATGFPGWQP